MEKYFLNISIQAPYLKVGSNSQQTKNIWVIFHGYGQLVEEFSKLFSPLISDENILLFPQGLSKFYLRGVDKKIGANWMTSQDRDIDIKNYLKYLDQLFASEIQPMKKDIKLHLLGFSQGGHTASRWVRHSSLNYDRLILWGSSLAHEIDQGDVSERFSAGENIMILGDQDRFISNEQALLIKNRYSKINFDCRLVEYHGGHDIDQNVLAKLL